MKILVLVLAFLIGGLTIKGCAKGAKFDVEAYCDPGEEAELSNVGSITLKNHRWDRHMTQVYEGNGFDELYTCLPSHKDAQYKPWFRVVKSVEVRKLRAGDIVQYFVEAQVTNEEEFEHMVVSYVVLSDSPLGVEGEIVSDAIGTNVLNRNTQHHLPITRSGVFYVEENVESVFVNFVLYAAHGYGRHGVGHSGLTIDQGYGEFDLIITRF
jgi:hypothetical protein